MKFFLLHGAIVKYDAIGNDIVHMQNILSEKGDCFVYCEHLNVDLPLISRNRLLRMLEDPECVIIYHHSIYWEDGETILKSCKGKIFIKYHNVTPGHFFAPYAPIYEQTCDRGREQTRRLARKFPQACWLGDSFFNLDDLNEFPDISKTVVAPFNNIPDWKKVNPDEAVLADLLKSKATNLLFVGRIVPNKGHKMLLEVVTEYINNYNIDIKLHIVGNRDENLICYNKELAEIIEQNNLHMNVKFIHQIDNSKMLSYYLGCDYYLCLSGHEGFCVPVIEAQSLLLPVIARQSSALPETLGDEQLLLADNIEEYTAAIHILLNNPNYEEYLTKKGAENFRKRFSNESIKKTFLNVLTDCGVQF